MHQYSRVYKYVIDNFVDDNEDYDIFSIQKKSFGPTHKDTYFIVNMAVISSEGERMPTNLRIPYEDIYE